MFNANADAKWKLECKVYKRWTLVGQAENGWWMHEKGTMNTWRTDNERTWNGSSTTLNAITKYKLLISILLSVAGGAWGKLYCFAKSYGSAIECESHRKLHNGMKTQRNGLYSRIISCFWKNNRDIYQESRNTIIGKFKWITTCCSGLTARFFFVAAIFTFWAFHKLYPNHQTHMFKQLPKLNVWHHQK